MTVRRGLSLSAPLAFALGALTLSACDGASPAGDDLIGQGGDPVVNTLALADLSVVSVDDYSGGLALGSQPTQTRLLVGRVADPLFGDVAATAYVDFARPALPDGFAGATPSSVALILPIGDLRLWRHAWRPSRSASRRCSETGRPRPISLDAGQAIQIGTPFSSVTLPDTARTVTVQLSSSWVASSDSLLTGSDYAAAFEGFALTPSATFGAVRGFTAGGIRLRVVAGSDTLEYFANEVYSRVVTTPPATGTSVRDGSGRALALNLPLEADSLRDSALSQARLVVRLDTSALQADGASARCPARSRSSASVRTARAPFSPSQGCPTASSCSRAPR